MWFLNGSRSLEGWLLEGHFFITWGVVFDIIASTKNSWISFTPMELWSTVSQILAEGVPWTYCVYFSSLCCGTYHQRLRVPTNAISVSESAGNRVSFRRISEFVFDCFGVFADNSIQTFIRLKKRGVDWLLR